MSLLIIHTVRSFDFMKHLWHEMASYVKKLLTHLVSVISKFTPDKHVGVD